MPADHVIGPDEQFHEAILEAAHLVEQDPERLITFGIRPTYPAESFGYIEPGARLETPSPIQLPVYHVRKFHEKPAADVAQKYLEAGTFFWNAGIFVWKARTILAALRQFEPQMYGHLARIVEAIDTREFSSVLRGEFAAIKGRSIDYAVMERSEQVAVIQAPFTWDDVGSWHAIARLCGTDQSGNTIVGKHLGIDTTGSIVRGRKDHLIVTVGLKDVIVVHTPDATLVASKQNEEAIRHVVKQLEQQGWQEYL
jgi:mannose-1-phosphate guanylyltransferase